MQKANIRWMIRRDMPDVLRTEKACFSKAWKEDDFLKVLRCRNSVGMVAEVNDRVVGFMLYELHDAKLHLLNFAVHPQARRQTVGRQMVQKLICKLSSHRRTRITLLVRETNLEAQHFFKSMDFIAIDVVRGYYEDTGEDAYSFAHWIPESSITEERPMHAADEFEGMK